MSLFEKIIAIYPELTPTESSDFFRTGVIILQNDSDGNGDYIAKWEHPTLSKPTQDQIDALKV